MAIHAQFYASGPYLHSPPEYHKGKDPYAETSAYIEAHEVNKMRNEGIERLRGQYNRALEMERRFYQLFGNDIKNQADWNRKFFGSNATNVQSPDTFNEDNIYSKTIKAINHRSIYTTLVTYLERQHEKYYKHAIDEVERIAIEQLGNQVQRGQFRLSPVNAKSLDALLKDIARAVGAGVKLWKNTSNTALRFGAVQKELSSMKFPKIGDKDVKTTKDLTQALNKWLESDNAKYLKGQLRGVSEENVKSIKEATEKLRQLLISFLKPEDFNYKIQPTGADKTIYQETKRNYIENVCERFSKKMSEAAETRQITYQLASGALGEISMVIVLENFALDNPDFFTVEHVATDMTKHRRVGSTGQHPVDIRIIPTVQGQQAFYNLQLKNTFASLSSRTSRAKFGLDITPGSINLPSTKTMNAFFDDLTIYREILNVGSANILKYQLANSAYRGTDLIVYVYRLLNLIVEHFVKSATATQLTEELNAAGVATGAAMENHFMIRPSVGLVPMSSLILLALQVLEGPQEAFSSPSIYGGSNTIAFKEGVTGPDPREMHTKKLNILTKSGVAGQHSGDQYYYPPELIDLGVGYGAKVLNLLPGPETALIAEAYRSALNSLF